MRGICDCPCIVKVGLGRGNKYYLIPRLEVHDANEWHSLKQILEPCQEFECGCKENNLADCVLRCDDGRIIAVEFKSSVDKMCKSAGKRVGCGLQASKIITVIVMSFTPYFRDTCSDPDVVTVTFDSLCRYDWGSLCKA
ncbi:hypothetical protein Pogu_1141 [Pyrobaculum oguniense TE7]|uniref:Uncharacterized protein n=1 Tax=Pyrobaculum oguniense (strain DSM 13380 / JCM 10595 / TE7) TaxID=698757 RepID=H6QA46_PYROT|nr:hypothetical protein Pogu_1141 [Pyrobaculum oguniense TE7]